VALKVGLSIFCNWKDVEKLENGGIDILRL
jgi:hypothetical protein